MSRPAASERRPMRTAGSWWKSAGPLVGGAAAAVEFSAIGSNRHAAKVKAAIKPPSPKSGSHRPSSDVLRRSAARTHQRRLFANFMALVFRLSQNAPLESGLLCLFDQVLDYLRGHVRI